MTVISKMEFFAKAANRFRKELDLRGLFDRLSKICFWLRNPIYETKSKTTYIN